MLTDAVQSLSHDLGQTVTQNMCKRKFNGMAFWPMGNFTVTFSSYGNCLMSFSVVERVNFMSEA